MYPGVHAKTTPDKPAVIMAGSGHILSHAELDALSNRGAHLFREIGLRPGDHVAIHLENHPLFFAVVWAAQRSGLIYTTIPTRLTAPEVQYILDDSGARAYVTSRALGDVAAELSTAALAGRFMLDGALAGFDSWEEATAALPSAPIADEVEGTDMLYSSGTTGRPKGVRVRAEGKPIGTPPATVLILEKLYEAGSDTVYLSPAPLYHAAPLRFNVSVQRLGGTTVIMESFDPEQALAAIERHRVTHSQWVPTMFVRMLKLPEEVRRRYDLSSLRAAVHAAAPCPIPVKEQMIAWWGPVLYEYYAGTEGNGFTAIDSRQWLTHKGSVGRALIGKVRILDDDGSEQPPGEPGTIYFADGSPFEYHNAPEKTAESRTADGASTLGDVGYVDEEGYLYLTDRKANMIISGGVNIYPQEAENVLLTHPKVADVAVFGVPNEEFGEEVKAVVQPVDMADAGPEFEQELIAFCREQISRIKCPRSVDFEAELPRHATGKLYKRLLRDRYWGGRSSRIV